VKIETRFEPAVDLPAIPLANAVTGIVAIALLAVVAIYWPTAQSIEGVWRGSQTFAHGYFIVPISLWLIWRKRSALAEIPAAPFWPGLWVIALAGAAWLVAALANVHVVQQFSLYAMLIGAIVTIAGVRVAKAITFPLLFLALAVPTGEFLVPKMMDWTADFTVAGLKLSGIPVYREGNELTVPSGRWSVVEACSGIRYLIASITVGFLYAYLNYRSPLRRAAFVVASIVVPFVANWLRAYLTVLIGHLSNNRIMVGLDHIVAGWAFFGFVILLLFWVGNFWREDDPISTDDAACGATPAALARRCSLQMDVPAIPPPFAPAPWRPLLNWFHAGTYPTPPAALEVTPAQGWVTTTLGAIEWKPKFSGESRAIHRAFAKGPNTVTAYIAFYRGQGQGHELITSDNALETTQSTFWRQVAAGAASIPWAGEPIAVRSAVLRGGNDRIIVRYWYWIEGRWTANDYVAKLLLALAKISGKGDDAALIAIYSMADQTESADIAISTFAREMGPAITQAIEQAARQ
jgi:exosortase A